MRAIVVICIFFMNLYLVAQKSEDDNSLSFIQQISFELYQKSNENLRGDLQGFSVSKNTLITQIGTENILNVKGDVNDYQTIEQRGNNNYYNFTDYYNSRTSRMQVLQDGNANSLQVIGTNSFSDNIIIRQKSNYKSVIVRNF